jgi:hypothetical protein
MMIADILAYSLVGIFAVFGVIAIGHFFFDKAPDKNSGFWGGVVFLCISLFFAWMWGI